MACAKGWPKLEQILEQGLEEAANANWSSHLSINDGLKLLADPKPPKELPQEVQPRRTVKDPRPGPLPDPGCTLLGNTTREEYVLIDADEEGEVYWWTVIGPEHIEYGKKPIRGKYIHLSLENVVPDLDLIEWDQRPADDLPEELQHTDRYYHQFYVPAWLCRGTGNKRLDELEAKILNWMTYCEKGQRNHVLEAIGTIRDEELYQHMDHDMFDGYRTFDDYLHGRFEISEEDLEAKLTLFES